MLKAIGLLFGLFALSVASGLTVFGIAKWIETDRAERRRIKRQMRESIVNAKNNVLTFMRRLVTPSKPASEESQAA